VTPEAPADDVVPDDKVEESEAVERR